MYERLNRSTENALAYRITTKLSTSEARQLTDELEGAISTAGKIRILIDLQAFPYGEMGALWEDLKFEFKYRKQIERLALAGGEEVRKWSSRIFVKLAGVKTGFFGPDQIDEAWQWLIEENSK